MKRPPSDGDGAGGGVPFVVEEHLVKIGVGRHTVRSAEGDQFPASR